MKIKFCFMLMCSMGLFIYGCSDEAAPPSKELRVDQNEESREHSHDHEEADGHDHDHEASEAHDHDEADADAHDHEEGDGHDHGHSHVAPHGGALIPLGDHFAHLELVLDAPSGNLTAYVLDSEPDKSLRISQEGILLNLQSITPQAALASVTLQPVANPLTGETAADTSQYEAPCESLKGAAAFTGQVAKLVIKGQTLENIAVRYPEGIEE